MKQMQHLCRMFLITQALYFILSEDRRGMNKSSYNLGSPSFSVTDQTHLPTILSRLRTLSHTSVDVFSCSPSLFPTRTTLSIKSPPERSERRKEEERTLICLCNMVQFAIGQWNSISFSPLVNIHLKTQHCLPFALSHLCSSAVRRLTTIRVQQQSFRKHLWSAQYATEKTKLHTIFCPFWSI